MRAISYKTVPSIISAQAYVLIALSSNAVLNFFFASLQLSLIHRFKRIASVSWLKCQLSGETWFSKKQCCFASSTMGLVSRIRKSNLRFERKRLTVLVVIGWLICSYLYWLLGLQCRFCQVAQLIFMTFW